MSAPTAPVYTGPAFLFEGDTFAVPSWEFHCDLPPVMPYPRPDVSHTITSVFGVQWAVYRSYEIDAPDVQRGVCIFGPTGDGLTVDFDCTVGSLREDDFKEGRAQYIAFRYLTPDEFMHALKAIAERNGE